MTDEIRQRAHALSALGHEVRLQVVRLLVAAHPAGLVAGEIQRRTRIPASTLSHHLDALHKGGILVQRREGRFLRYLAATDMLEGLAGFLREGLCDPAAPPPNRRRATAFGDWG
jgi:DNA-binding transcriptional ArsR family regulator